MIRNLINITDALAIINTFEEREFTSHKFIEEYKQLHRHEYEILESNYSENAEQKVNSLIARYLQMRQGDGLPITQIGKVISPNCHGNKTRCENWRIHINI